MSEQERGTELLIKIVKWGWGCGHILEIFGDALAREIMVFLSLNANKQWLLDNLDYWDTIREPVPDAIAARLRGLMG